MSLSPPDNHLDEPSWFKQIRPFGKKMLQVPGLRALRPFAQKVTAVAEPIGAPSLRAHPPRSLPLHNNTITVLSANLWHDWPRFRDQTARLERLACLVEREGVDILLLQEVSRTPKLQVDHWLSQRLGMTSVYSRANGQAAAIGFEEGLAILSHFPLTAPRLQQLGTSQNPFVRRLALSADVITPGGMVALFSVHLGLLPHHNARQLTHLFTWVSALAHDRPALIGGDFNAHDTSLRIRHMQHHWLDTYHHLHPQKKGVTHELRAWGNIPLSRRRLDYIFLKAEHPSHWQVTEVHHLDSPGGAHSDHRAVLLRLKNQTSATSNPDRNFS